jgi:hypothetical protein
VKRVCVRERRETVDGSLPAREHGLKLVELESFRCLSVSLPVQERGLKLSQVVTREPLDPGRSPCGSVDGNHCGNVPRTNWGGGHSPRRECGLKHGEAIDANAEISRRSPRRAGAWIEPARDE